MAKSSPVLPLTDIIEAIELIRSEMEGVTLDAFEPDRRKRWLVERGIETISEASRRLPQRILGRKWLVSAMCCAMIMRTLRYGTRCMTTCRI